jgi:hypothetical protein
MSIIFIVETLTDRKVTLSFSSRQLKAIGGKEYTGLRRIFVHLRGAEMGA